MSLDKFKERTYLELTFFGKSDKLPSQEIVNVQEAHMQLVRNQSKAAATLMFFSGKVGNKATAQLVANATDKVIANIFNDVEALKNDERGNSPNFRR